MTPIRVFPHGVYAPRTALRLAMWRGVSAPSDGYRYIRIDYNLYPEHRLAWLHMTGEWPTAGIDHINCDRLDNRWSNLREATKAKNAMNMHIRADNTSGYKGVSWSKIRRKWIAHITVDRKCRHLGSFDTPECAFIAYMKAAWDHFGDYAQIDTEYLKAIREHKARPGWQRDVLWNLANPDYARIGG
jgi:hypothetical protein